MKKCQRMMSKERKGRNGHLSNEIPEKMSVVTKIMSHISSAIGPSSGEGDLYGHREAVLSGIRRKKLPLVLVQKIIVLTSASVKQDSFSGG